ncbi:MULTISPECIES: DUF1652 domain-containing protein [unclassified Pseudomonas]|uniref:DUF1652 domain-containing protein n=1 Tax=unclassified Pseudomonas TaxID=196821 RepID=UPI001BCCF18B|nr:DUF1652 domain-containing protein [Pseudomonas sp. Pc102]BBP80818.1 hypothetical protein PHLH8_04600 [Pseudomonas sp. Pc102]
MNTERLSRTLDYMRTQLLPLGFSGHMDSDRSLHVLIFDQRTRQTILETAGIPFSATCGKAEALHLVQRLKRDIDAQFRAQPRNDP